MPVSTFSQFRWPFSWIYKLQLYLALSHGLATFYIFPIKQQKSVFILSFTVSVSVFLIILLSSQGSQHYYYSGLKEHNSGVFGRFRTRHSRSASQGSLDCNMIDLRTSLIKLDAEDTDLRLCFRIISPQKTYTLLVPYLLYIETWRKEYSFRRLKQLISLCYRLKMEMIGWIG